MSIMQSLPIYVAALSRDLKTRVTFGGNDAYCEKLHNEWLVNIPVFDVNNEETCAAAYAYALHESGHVKFTDFDAADHAEKQLPFNQALVRHLSNVFEDTYIERSLSKELKGAFARLSRMRVWLTSQSNFDENEIANKETKDLIVQFMYYQAFSEVGYDAYKSRLVIVENEFRDRTGDAFVDGLKAILVRCRTLSSSLQCVELTNDVLVYLKDEIDNQQQQQQQQKGGSQQQPQQGGEQNQQNGDDANDDQSGNGQSQSGDDANDDQSGNGQSQSGDDANDDQSGNGQSQSGDDANDDQSGNGQSNAFDNSSSQGDQQSNSNATQSSQNAQAIKDVLDGKAELDETSDAGKALAEKLSNQSKEDVKNGKVNPSDLQDANRANASNIKEKVMRSDHRYVPMLTQSAEKQTVYVRNRIRNLIAAKQLVHVSRKTSGRRLISTAGTRLATGDSRVFRKKEQVKLTNTAITILLDDSGSMDGERGQVASIATQAIIQALSTVNFVKTSVLTFGSDNANAVYRVKNFDESPYRCVQRLSSHLCSNGCYTPLLQGLWGGLKELSQRQEQRKVMLVITDGAPDNRVACRDLISRIRKSSDCEVFGIGIGDADQLVKPLFGDKFAVSVSNIDNLADEIFKLSEQILIK